MRTAEVNTHHRQADKPVETALLSCGEYITHASTQSTADANKLLGLKEKPDQATPTVQIHETNTEEL